MSTLGLRRIIPGWRKRVPRPKRAVISLNDFQVEVLRKPIKSFRLVIYPSDARVRVSAPLQASDETIRKLLLDRSAWISEKRKKILAMPRPVALSVVSGEEHYFLGQTYRIELQEKRGANRVYFLGDGVIQFQVSPGTSVSLRKKMLLNWYRDQLEKLIPDLIRKWEPVLGVKVAEWGIKKMRTRWGSCNIRARRIWLNLELAKYSIAAIEYVVVHEMVHLLEKYHNARFKALVNGFLPNWKEAEGELKQMAGALSVV